MINTVLGPIAGEKLGVTMMHEHLVPTEVVPEFPGKKRFVEPLSLDAMVEQLLQAKEFGLDSVVDCTPSGMSRDPAALRYLAEQTGLNIIASTGFYKEPRIPAPVYGAAIAELTEFMVRELTEGIEGAGFKAGMIKVGSSMGRVTKVEEKVLRAAARAHLETGAPITTHSTLGTAGLEQIRIFEEEEVDFSRVVIGHAGLNSSFAYHKLIATYGATAGFDTIGKERFDYTRLETAGAHRYEFEKEAYYIPDAQLVSSIKAMVEAGFAGHIVLSSDILRSEAYINPGTIGSCGYSYVLYKFVPLLREAGVGEEALHKMLVETPRRILDFA